MKYPYVISSDQHHHNWSQFARTLPSGVNSRLQAIIDENERAASRLIAEGGNNMFLAGDLFHVRGRIEPSVFNPTVKSFERILNDGHSVDLLVHAIPGNHDLEGKHADELGNAMQALGSITGFNVCTKPTLVHDVIVIPWFHDLNDLRAILAEWAAKPKADRRDVIIHAPVNGVLKGLPEHGLEASELAAYGFRRVFSGHYHDYKVMEGDKVISVGATTHQTWSDPGTRAGFLLVWEDRIEHVPTSAPQFVDLSEEIMAEIDATGHDVADVVNGCYVRLKLTDVTEKEIKEWREDLKFAGALDVLILATKTTTVSRTGAAAKAAISLEATVEHYVRNDLKPLLADEVSKLAQETLMEARS